MLKPREEVLRIPEYSPPLGDRDGLRLDFNENTAGASPRVLARLREITAADLATYPVREPGERLVAEFLDVSRQQILLTNGVDEALHLLAETYLGAGDEVLFSEPTFAMYSVYAAATGATPVAVHAGADFTFPTQSLLERITPHTRMIAIANPNNPTGAAVARADLLRIAAAAPNAAVVVDEAYFDFYGETVLGDLKRSPNLFITRTFSKAYGMAGLRVGVIVAAAQQMSFVRRVASPYNLNGVALACLPAALEDRDYVASYVAQVRAGRTELERRLAAAQVPYWPSQANFVLIRIGPKRTGFLRAMRRRGVLVRDRNSDPGCQGCVRITVGDAAANRLLWPALAESLTEIGWTPADARLAAEVGA